MGSDLPAIQAACIRYLFGLLLLAPFVVKSLKNQNRPTTSANRTKKSTLTRLYFIRGLFHAAAVGCWFYAMARLPVALITAIGFLTPISITLAASFFLGEKIRIRRLLSVIVAFSGAIIILAPEFSKFNLVIIVQLLAAQCFAISYLFAKVLSSKASSEEIVGMLTFYCALALLPIAIYQWTTPSQEELILLSLTAVVATFGHYAISEAVKNTSLTLLQPFAFLQLIWATLMGIFIFSEEPSANLFIGSAIIIASTTYIAHREVATKGKA